MKVASLQCCQRAVGMGGITEAITEANEATTEANEAITEAIEATTEAND